jgi:hypothetical protein
MIKKIVAKYIRVAENHHLAKVSKIIVVSEEYLTKNYDNTRANHLKNR